jgi:hypothetical protein
MFGGAEMQYGVCGMGCGCYSQVQRMKVSVIDRDFLIQKISSQAGRKYHLKRLVHKIVSAWAQ